MVTLAVTRYLNNYMSNRGQTWWICSRNTRRHVHQIARRAMVYSLWAIKKKGVIGRSSGICVTSYVEVWTYVISIREVLLIFVSNQSPLCAWGQCSCPSFCFFFFPPLIPFPLICFILLLHSSIFHAHHHTHTPSHYHFARLTITCASRLLSCGAVLLSSFPLLSLLFSPVLSLLFSLSFSRNFDATSDFHHPQLLNSLTWKLSSPPDPITVLSIQLPFRVILVFVKGPEQCFR